MAAEALAISQGHQKMIMECLKANGGSCSYEVLVVEGKVEGVGQERETQNSSFDVIYYAYCLCFFFFFSFEGDFPLPKRVFVFEEFSCLSY